MRDLQQKTKEFCKENDLVGTPEARFLDTISEFGEVGKEMLKSSKYGTVPTKKTNAMEMEIGDALFSLMTLANALDIDLDEALSKAMKKYEDRIGSDGSPGYGGKNGQESSS